MIAHRSGPDRGRRLAAACVLASTALALAACASLQAPTPTDRLEGRLALLVGATPGREATSATLGFVLTGDSRRGELRLTQALGLQLAHARWAPGQASLSTADEQLEFEDVAQLAAHALGEPLPLQALPDWLRARAWPGADWRPSADGFAQLGFEVRLGRVAEGFIEIVRPAQAATPAVRLRIKLADPVS